MIKLLKSTNRLAREGNLFRCFCGVPSNLTSFLSKLNWYNGTAVPYYHDNKIYKTKIKYKFRMLKVF
ncbi:MAG: hypothetical protein ACE5SW_08780 [Nitrososphaeraceae archaeon]